MLPLAAASAQLLSLVMPLVELATSDEFELRASARLFGNDLKSRLMVRIVLLITGGIVLPLMHLPAAALLVAIAGELLGRYWFSVIYLTGYWTPYDGGWALPPALTIAGTL